MQMGGGNAVADFFKTSSFSRRGDVYIMTLRGQTQRQSPSDRFRAALAFRRNPIIKQKNFHPQATPLPWNSPMQTITGLDRLGGGQQLTIDA